MIPRMSEPLTFDERVVVVTGAGNGVGRAHALDLARRGARVVVNDLGGSTDGRGNDDAAASRVVAEIEAAGGTAVANFDSVATPEGGERIIATALSTWGRVDAVIANAGFLRDKSFVKLEVADLDAILDVHLRGAFFTVAPAFRWMKDNGGGRIVVTTSASGLYGNFGQTNYAAAKLGVVGLMRTLSIEGARSGITANAIAPIASTRLTRGADGDHDDPMAPWKVSPLAVALCHHTNQISGETFLAGGGVYARSWVALGPGWRPEEAEMTAEGVMANWGKIRDSSSFVEPDNALALTSWLTQG